MKYSTLDCQIIFLATSEMKEIIKDRAFGLGLVNKNGGPHMSKFIRMATDYAIENYRLMTIEGYSGSTMRYKLKSDGGIIKSGVELFYPKRRWIHKAPINDRSLVGKKVIVDFMDEINAVCIDVEGVDDCGYVGAPG